MSGTLWAGSSGRRLIHHLDAETGELLGSNPFPTARIRGLYWDDSDDSLVGVESNQGAVFHLDPTDGTLRRRWRITGLEVHGMTRDDQGRVWVCDALTNDIAIVE